MTECSIEDCSGKHLARGYCAKHYQRAKKGEAVACSIDECGRPSVARGWCDKHYARFRKYGDVNAIVRKKSPRRAPCSIEGCEAISSAKGYCPMHYQRRKKRGDANAKVRPVYREPVEALANRSRQEGDCLIWTGPTSVDGYGRTWNGERNEGAHRIAYRLAYGPIPDGMEVDHTCWNRACIAPRHLRLATRQQNVWNQSGVQARSRTGLRGVHPSHNGKKFYVVVAGKHLGTYADKSKAATIAANKRAELFGAYAGNN